MTEYTADKKLTASPELFLYLKRHTEIILAFLIASVLFYEGFFVLALGVSEAGAFNPLAAVFLLFFIMVCFAKNNVRIGWGITLSFMMITFFLFIGIFSAEEGGAVKSLRDFIYLTIIFLFFPYFNTIIKHRALSPKKFVFFLTIFTIVIYPFIGACLGFTGYEGRFPGFNLSPPIFANGVLLTYLIYKGGNGGGRFLEISFFLTSCFLIFISGTRSPLIMIVLYEAMFLIFSTRRERKMEIFVIITSLLLLSSFLLFEGNNFRIFSLDDIHSGSLSTRLHWYALLLNDIAESGFFGGFGPGAAEEKLGYIPHFDLLRLWYDYSIFCVIFTCLFFFTMAVASGFKFSLLSAKKFFIETSFFIVSLINFVFLTMHNALQVPGLVLLITIWIYFSYPHRILEGR